MYGQYSMEYRGAITHHERAIDYTGKRVAKTLESPAHAWAHMAQSFGQSSKGNLFFEGAALYSYGYHYLVGFRISPTGDRHAGVALLNADKNSVTTNRHRNEASHATRHLEQHFIPELTELRYHLCVNPQELTESAKERIAHHVASNIEEYEDSAAIYMLTYAGDSNAAKTVAKRRKKVAESLIQEAKRNAKSELANAVSVARNCQAHFKNREQLDKFIAAETDNLIRSDRSHELDRMEQKVRKAHKALPKLTHGKLKAVAWQMVKELTAAKRAGHAKYLRKVSREHFHSRVEIIRSNAANLASNPETVYQSNQLFDWRNACQFVAGYLENRPKLGGKARSSLIATAAELNRRGNARAVIECAERDERERVRQAEQFRKEAEKRADWMLGAPVHFYGADENGKALLRVKAGRLETSMGAAVPLDDAIKVFRLVKLCKVTGMSWQRNGHTLPVGSYQVDSVYPNGDFKAGCHLIGWSEVERIARELGVFELDATDTSKESAHA